MSHAKINSGSVRRAPRLAVDLEATLVGRLSHPVRLLDLSAVGCLLRCDTLLEPGAILDLHLNLEDDPFEAKVRVVDSSLDGSTVPPGSARSLAGLEFVSLAARHQARLRRFLEDERRRRRSADASAR